MSKRKLVFANNPLLSGPGYEERQKLGIPYREIDLDLIDRDQNQPRVSFDEAKLKELAQSIKLYGILSPILVKPSKTIGRFRLVSGERRYRAATLLGLKSVPALVDQSADESGARTLAMQLVENIQRADLSPLERAHAIGALKDAHNLSIREIADRLGLSKSMVQRSLEILDLPDDLLNALRQGASESKILLLSKIEDQEIRASYLRDIDDLTRDKLKKSVDSNMSKSGSKATATQAEDRRISDEMERSLGMKVRLVRSRTRPDYGRVLIHFSSEEDLQEISRRLIELG